MRGGVVRLTRDNATNLEGGEKKIDPPLLSSHLVYSSPRLLLSLPPSPLLLPSNEIFAPYSPSTSLLLILQPLRNPLRTNLPPLARLLSLFFTHDPRLQPPSCPSHFRMTKLQCRPKRKKSEAESRSAHREPDCFFYLAETISSEKFTASNNCIIDH